MTVENIAFPIEPFVRLSGDIDITCGSQLSHLEKTLADREHVILDVSNVQYFDTTFLRFLANLGRHAKKAQRANVKLLGVTPHLRRVLEITGLIRVFDAEFDLA